MNVSAKKPVFRMRQSTGFASMSDLWKAALFLGDLMDWSIVIEGVTHVSPNAAGVVLDAPPLSSASDGAGLNVTPKLPKFSFKRRSGTALHKDLREFAAWVREQLVRQMESDDFTGASSHAQNTQVEFRRAP